MILTYRLIYMQVPNQLRNWKKELRDALKRRGVIHYCSLPRMIRGVPIAEAAVIFSVDEVIDEVVEEIEKETIRSLDKWLTDVKEFGVSTEHGEQSWKSGSRMHQVLVECQVLDTDIEMPPERKGLSIKWEYPILVVKREGVYSFASFRGEEIEVMSENFTKSLPLDLQTMLIETVRGDIRFRKYQ